MLRPALPRAWLTEHQQPPARFSVRNLALKGVRFALHMEALPGAPAGMLRVRLEAEQPTGRGLQQQLAPLELKLANQHDEVHVRLLGLGGEARFEAKPLQ